MNPYKDTPEKRLVRHHLASAISYRRWEVGYCVDHRWVDGMIYGIMMVARGIKAIPPSFRVKEGNTME